LLIPGRKRCQEPFPHTFFPIYTQGRELGTQVAVGSEEGLKHPSWIFCDDLASVRKSQLTDLVGTLSSAKLSVLSPALRIALDIP
jgi:mRNA interferase MazF